MHVPVLQNPLNTRIICEVNDEPLRKMKRFQRMLRKVGFPFFLMDMGVMSAFVWNGIHDQLQIGICISQKQKQRECPKSSQILDLPRSSQGQEVPSPTSKVSTKGNHQLVSYQKCACGLSSPNI